MEVCLKEKEFSTAPVENGPHGYTLDVTPKWRSDGAKNHPNIQGINRKIPNIQGMIGEIKDFHSEWMRNRTSYTDRIKSTMDTEFFKKLQKEEDIGHCNNEAKTMQVLEALDENKNDKTKNGWTDSTASKELINLVKTFRGLELRAQSDDSDDDDWGLLDIEEFVQDNHSILMDGCLETKKTGEFSSTTLRSTEYRGETHLYPVFTDKSLSWHTLQVVIDKYNQMVDPKREHRLESIFKAAAMLLFAFLAIHPFTDGNGRLGRLLCSYTLSAFSPFHTAVYNAFRASSRKDYIDALVAARQNVKEPESKIRFKAEAEAYAQRLISQSPVDLCALIVESNWFTWKRFHTLMDEEIER